uniref:uncharacterized protein LOC122596145 isoform X2 n=1 Tax=Erigeron canadensis TaxID=72917 RepID=UPI001CB89367|nr:uncharacterized protein LOC122596145 isoform X2 [Erigeron canadensis]
MALISGSVTSFTGLNISKPLLPSPKLTANTLVNYPKTHVCFEKTSVTRPLYFVRGGYGAKYVLSAGSRNYEPSSHYDGNRPFWLAPSQEFMRALKSVFVFLAEQPSQLKYIEWPGFQNTLKTATLTLVLVAMLIVVLSSVDSGLWYLLASILRKPA